MSTEQLYCVVATNRTTKKRNAITGGMQWNLADIEVARFHVWKKTHYYFKVAKFPYKEKNHGGGK